MVKSFFASCAALICVASGAHAAEIRTLEIETNDLAYDRTRGLLYASVPSVADEHPNSIVAIDPQTGAVVKSLFVGSEPNKLALSRDCSLLYVGLDGTSVIRPVDLTAWQIRASFPLPVTPRGGYATEVVDLAVAPDDAGTVVATLRSPRAYNAGLIVAFDNGKPRRRMVDWYDGGLTVEFSSQSNRLFGAFRANSYIATYRLDLKKKGLWARLGEKVEIPGSYPGISYAGDRLYAVDGAVVDPWQKRMLGSFAVESYGRDGDLVPDPARRRAYALRGNALLYPTDEGVTWNLIGFDTELYTPHERLEIPDVRGRVASLVRWGTSGFAFRTEPIYYPDSSAAVYLVDWPEVPAAPDLSGDWQALKGSGSGKGATARFKWTGKLTVRSEGANEVPRTGVRYFVSDDATLDAGDVLVGQYDVPALAANGSVTLKVKIAGPKGLSGRGKYLLAQFDGYNEVAEPNDENNVAAFGPLP